MAPTHPNRFNLLDALAIALIAISVPLIVVGIVNVRTNMEDVMQWLPDDSTKRKEYEWFQNRFGTDDFVVVTWDGCHTGDPRIAEFVQTASDADDGQLLGQLLSGPGLVNRVARKTRMPRREVARRFTGLFFDDQLKQTCIVVELSSRGMRDRRAAVDLLKTAADMTSDLSRDNLMIAGYPYVGSEADAEIRQSALKLLLPACLVATLLAWISIGRIRTAVLTFIVASLATGISIAVVTLSGAMWGALTIIAPCLTFILSVSGCLHLLRYAARLEKPFDPRALLRIGWKPCVVSSVSTAVGMAALGRSDFLAIRMFGFHCAAGVIASLVCQLVLVPVLVNRWPGGALPENGSNRSMEPGTDSILARIIKNRWAILFLTLVFCTAAVWGVSRLRVDLRVERFFRQDSKFLDELAWIESRIGPVERTELIVEFSGVDPDQFARRLEFVRNLEVVVTDLPTLSYSHSLSNYLPAVPEFNGVRGAYRRTVYSERLAELRTRLAGDGYLVIDGNREIWRISLRMPFSADVNFAELENRVLETANELVSRYRSETAGGAALGSSSPKFTYTGISHLYYTAQSDLLSDLFNNFLLAFLVITPMMIIALRSLGLGLLAMTPNVAPALLTFGVLGMADFPIDMGIAMTASVALGIAVDDTAHLLIRFRDLSVSHGRGTGFQLAYAQCIGAMIQSTLIIGTALLVFLLSSFSGLIRFMLMLVGLLSAALIFDLLFLPAMLAVARVIPPWTGVVNGETLTSHRSTDETGDKRRQNEDRQTQADRK